MNNHVNKENELVAKGLSVVLADTYSLYLKTQNFHWNVTGPRFHQLHNMFEDHYKKLAIAVDDIAERIRALGHMSPGSFEEFMNLTTIQNSKMIKDSDSMIAELVKDHERVSQQAKEVIVEANKNSDDVTVDFLTGRMRDHQKTAWMLRSCLQ